MSKNVEQVVDSGMAVDNQKEAIGRRLREARTALHMTQNEFCAAVGMPLPTLRDQELCKRIPGGESMLGFTRAGINANWLLTGEGDMFLGKAPEATQLEVTEQRYSYNAQPVVDPVLLQQVIDFFYQWLQENRDQVRIDRSRHGTIISVLYKIAAQSGTFSAPDLAQVLRMAA